MYDGIQKFNGSNRAIIAARPAPRTPPPSPSRRTWFEPGLDGSMDLELGLAAADDLADLADTVAATCARWKAPTRCTRCRSAHLLPELHVAALCVFVSLLGVATIILSSAGSWNGCVLSAAWCTGEGALAAPYESWRRGLVATLGTAGVALNLKASMGCQSMGGATREGRRHGRGLWLSDQRLSILCQLCVVTCCVVRSFEFCSALRRLADRRAVPRMDASLRGPPPNPTPLFP